MRFRMWIAIIGLCFFLPSLAHARRTFDPRLPSEISVAAEESREHDCIVLVDQSRVCGYIVEVQVEHFVSITELRSGDIKTYSWEEIAEVQRARAPALPSKSSDSAAANLPGFSDHLQLELVVVGDAPIQVHQLLNPDPFETRTHFEMTFLCHAPCKTEINRRRGHFLVVADSVMRPLRIDLSHTGRHVQARIYPANRPWIRSARWMILLDTLGASLGTSLVAISGPENSKLDVAARWAGTGVAVSTLMTGIVLRQRYRTRVELVDLKVRE